MPSQNLCFVNSYLSYLMSKFINQFETPFLLRVSIILFYFSSDVARNCSKFSWFLFSRSTLISPLVLPSLLLVRRTGAWRFNVILVESFYSFSAVFGKSSSLNLLDLLVMKVLLYQRLNVPDSRNQFMSYNLINLFKLVLNIGNNS